MPPSHWLTQQLGFAEQQEREWSELQSSLPLTQVSNKRSPTGTASSGSRASTYGARRGGNGGVEARVMQGQVCEVQHLQLEAWQVVTLCWGQAEIEERDAPTHSQNGRVEGDITAHQVQNRRGSSSERAVKQQSGSRTRGSACQPTQLEGASHWRQGVRRGLLMAQVAV